MKKNFLNLLSIIFVLLIITGCGCNKKQESKEEKKETNSNNPVIKYETVGNLKFGTASFYVSGEKTYVTTSVINETKNDIKVNQFYVLLVDNDGKTLTKINVDLGVVKAGETKEINESIDGKYLSTEKITYEIK